MEINALTRMNQLRDRLLGRVPFLARARLPAHIRREAAYPAALFALLMGLYVFTMSEHTTLEDSGAFILVVKFAGIAHPPGYPLYTMLGKLYSLLPFGNFAFRIQLLSATAGALACVWVYFCCLALSAARWPAFFAALFFGVSGMLWRQSLIAEVYSLHAMFYFLCLYLVLRMRHGFRRRELFCLAFFFALGLSHHWPLLVLNSLSFFPLLLVGAIHTMKQNRPLVALADAPKLAGLFCLGLLPYLYVVIRSLFEPYIAAYGPVSFSGLLDYVLRTRYAATDVNPTASIQDTLLFVRYFFHRYLAEIGAVSALAACAGLAYAVFTKRWSVTLALLIGFCSSSLILLFFLHFDYDILRREAYMSYQAVPFGIGAIALHYALAAALHGRPGKLRQAIPAVAGLAFCMTTLAQNLERNDMRDNSFAYDYARTVLESLPRDAILFLFGDQHLGPISYTGLVAGVRPDVRIYSPFGHLFGNRLFNMETDSVAYGQEKIKRFMKKEERLFFTTQTRPFDMLREHGFHYHGLYYEVSLSRTQTPDDRRRELARAFLDRYRDDPHSDLWSYYRQRVIGESCHVLALAGESHPAFQEHYACRRALAAHLLFAKENARASERFRALLDEDVAPWPKPEREWLYEQYLRAELARIPEDSGDAAAKLKAYQRAVDRVFPATEIRPVCDNEIPKLLLEIGLQVPVDIRLAKLVREFGHCRNLRPLFAKAKKAQQERKGRARAK